MSYGNQGLENGARHRGRRRFGVRACAAVRGARDGRGARRPQRGASRRRGGATGIRAQHNGPRHRVRPREGGRGGEGFRPRARDGACRRCAREQRRLRLRRALRGKRHGPPARAYPDKRPRACRACGRVRPWHGRAQMRWHLKRCVRGGLHARSGNGDLLRLEGLRPVVFPGHPCRAAPRWRARERPVPRPRAHGVLGKCRCGTHPDFARRARCPLRCE